MIYGAGGGGGGGGGHGDAHDQCASKNFLSHEYYPLRSGRETFRVWERGALSVIVNNNLYKRRQLCLLKSN